MHLLRNKVLIVHFYRDIDIAWSCYQNMFKSEGIYGRFDHVRTRIYIEISIQNKNLISFINICCNI